MSYQTSFQFKTHGGFRKGAGRKRMWQHDPEHTSRPRMKLRTPSHVTLRFVEGVPNLRCEDFFLEFTRALDEARGKGLAITQFAVESNHIHLLIEVEDNEALTKGILSLQGCLVWGLRRVFKHVGRVFDGRFHIRTLSTPTEMRNGLIYVVFNHSQHCKVERFADVFSSAFAWRNLSAFVRRTGRPPKWQTEITRVLSQPRSWLQNFGWRRAR